ncbi:hypothetical protein R5W24_000885 [Gemmata sp. JC717]|uniref:hypothetical protein n=1 Tax=Gemmata algarum TaxID=2975278 RepID=UPI0021BB7BEF|nr:hypothetical protein [Gemmata algarum]MDY3551805.1 hypothetical protein [Gemmata algarum]
MRYPTRWRGSTTAVWCEDEAAPLQTIPHVSTYWQLEGHPARHPHEYVRDGIAKVPALF